MTTQPTSQPTRTTVRPPWERNRLPYGIKLIAMTGFLTAGFIGLCTTLTLVMVGFSATIRSAQDLLVLAVTAGVAIFGWGLVVWLWPYVSAPNRFTPTSGAIAPMVAGQPFEVRLRQIGMQTGFRGKGTIRFAPDSLVLSGFLAPSGWLQLGTVLLLTVLPLVLFGVGLGILPAMAICILLGRRKREIAVPYSELRDVQLNGGELRFRRINGVPARGGVFISQIDGERLYREVAARFPAAAPVWASTGSTSGTA